MNDSTPRALLCTLAELAELSDALLRGQGAPLRFAARGGSMRPCIHDGDVVVVEPCMQPRCGDVVLAAQSGRVLVHRVLGRAVIAGRAYVFTRGDAAPQPDAPVPVECVLGRVAQVERPGRPPRFLPVGMRRALVYLWVRGRHVARQLRAKARALLQLPPR